jgi:hypothetical protein
MQSQFWHVHHHPPAFADDVTENGAKTEQGIYPKFWINSLLSIDHKFIYKYPGYSSYHPTMGAHVLPPSLLPINP